MGTLQLMGVPLRERALFSTGFFTHVSVKGGLCGQVVQWENSGEYAVDCAGSNPVLPTRAIGLALLSGPIRPALGGCH